MTARSKTTETKRSARRILKVFQTSQNKALKHTGNLFWDSQRPPVASRMIDLHPDLIIGDPIVGFGAAVTGGAAHVFMALMPADTRNEALHLMCSDSQMAMNLARVGFGPTDFEEGDFTYLTGPLTEDLANVSFEHELKYRIPLLKEMLAINPDLKMCICPWSAEGPFTSTHDHFGGTLMRRRLDLYARILAMFVAFYEKHLGPGVVRSVSTNNEVDTTQNGNGVEPMPQMSIPQEVEVDFVRALRKALDDAGFAHVKIYIVEHNADKAGRFRSMLGSLADVANVEAAVHPYVGDLADMALVRDAMHCIMHLTECTPDLGIPPFPNEVARWMRTFCQFLRYRMSSIVCWNWLLTQLGLDRFGPFKCGGFSVWNTETEQWELSGQAKALAHFSSFIKRGASVFRTFKPEELGNLDVVGLINPDGSMVVVLVNSGLDAQTISLRLGKKVADISLEPDSGYTLLI
jgi:glucosylceramidase